MQKRKGEEGEVVVAEVVEGQEINGQMVNDVNDLTNVADVSELMNVVDSNEKHTKKKQKKPVPELSIEHLTKTFDSGSITANKDVSFQVQPGEFFALLGHNGAGKTTLIRQILGILPMTSGDIKVKTEETMDSHPTSSALKSIKTDRHFVHDRIAFCPQDNPFWPKFTLRNHLRLFGELGMGGVGNAENTRMVGTDGGNRARGDGGSGGSAATRNATTRAPLIATQAAMQEERDALDALIIKTAQQMGLGHVLDTPCKNLSGGQKQRAWVWRNLDVIIWRWMQ